MNCQSHIEYLMSVVIAVNHHKHMNIVFYERFKK